MRKLVITQFIVLTEKFQKNNIIYKRFTRKTFSFYGCFFYL